ncbi:Flp pilus assembly complex ATPase component TadA [Candidatus Woesebacteria bacterium]|jgi:type IV pilus assembly protein PilB|nr:Flp pilus assembly complex ATPase component TadA [Candidatus Woesebacteria bacterium]
MIISNDQLAQLVLNNGLVDKAGLEELSQYAKNANLNLDQAILEKNVIPDETLGLLIANYIKVPFVTLTKLAIPEEVFHIVPEKVARKQKVIAFERSPKGIKIAMANPYNQELIKLVAQKTSQSIIPYMATEKDIYNTFHIYRKELQKNFDDLISEEAEKAGSVAAAESEAPIAKIVDLLISFAYQDKVSDIHIEPEEKNSLVRFRIDGILHDVLFLSKFLHDRIATRIKVMAKLRTDEHLAPQDGKIRVKVEDEDLDIRISILPVSQGEKIVMRLLSSRLGKLSLLDLGMSEVDLKKVSNAYSRSYGMILSTGPTGSGKTSSIYSILKILNTREKNITTIEDPVEYQIRGVNQIQVNTKTNLTFANGLRSILRQDPNIVFVGEIRDSETAGIAVNAALTGHLVLSTLHTNDAATTMPRLIDMKVEPFLVASTVNVVIAQRLIRKICENCRISYIVTEDELKKNLPEEIIKRHYLTTGDKKEIRLYKGQGCKICHFTGYSGRVGLFEVMEITEKLRSLIVQKSSADEIKRQAVADGMHSMLDDGLQKVARGMTTVEEVLRITKVDSL